MNSTAIYSKSGKGVQEAAGKTSLLKRPDRAVLAAIDGRATLADVAQKVGKPFDPGFQQLITQLDKDGFIREVSPGTASANAAPAAAAKPAPAVAKPAAKAAPADPASDLDFSSIGMGSKPALAPAPAGPKPDAAAAARAKEQEAALFKARQDAEAKAAADRERQRTESEARMRAETEARLRAETEAKLRAEAEAKAQVKAKAEAEGQIKAAREAAVRAAAEAKAKADAEARRAKEEAERARNEAEELKRRQEEAERSRKEAEAQARQAREEAERIRKEAEAERRQLEAERKREEEERAERRRREEEEGEARRKQRDEEERREEEERAARRRQRDEDELLEEQEKQAAKGAKAKPEEEERREEEERAARRRQREEQERREEQQRQAAKETKPKEAKKGGIGGFADSLLADLASFTKRDDDERKEQAEAERKENAAKEEAARQAREEAEHAEKDEAKRRRREEDEQRRREEEEVLRASEEKDKERLREEEEKRKQEAEERARKAKEEEKRMAGARKHVPDVPAGELGMRRRGVREAQLAAAQSKFRRPRKWGRPVAIFLAVVLLIALAIAHVMPIKTDDFERAASEALGRPVKIGSARLWLLTGLQIRFQNVTLGEDVSIAAVHAFPQLSSLQEPRKAFSRVELARLRMPQQALGETLFARLKSANFSVARVIVNDLELTGPLALPKGIDVDASLNPDGSLRAASLRGPEGLSARLAARSAAIDFEMSASSFTLPIAPAISFAQFSMKGSASRQGMTIAEWDGGMLNGTISGTANVRWGGNWTVDGVLTARGINAAVFAPALLSEGRAEGTGRFSMSGADPAKLASGGRVEGSFTIMRGVLGSFDLSQAIRTSGRNVQGRTQFAEMHGQAVYNRGAVALRNVTIGAGALNAGASADITQSGALSGRIVADVRTVAQTLSATLLLGGTVKEPQVKN